ncbi:MULTISPECIES: WD40/YVTN/BNR-like repeat-containing protein [Marinobacter]|nr:MULTISPECIES: YCF48-related protein [Marinobacter]
MATWKMRETLGAACLGFSMALSAPAAFALADIIETPARKTDLAPQSLLNDADRAGERVVAVGERGHIIYSDDEGQTWKQASVPVAVTLTAVDFSTDRDGWAVGHSGVILHSSDAGASWELQLTGIQAAELAIESKETRIGEMEVQIEEAPEDQKEDLEWALDDLIFSVENMKADLKIGPVNPLLDVWFEDAEHGFAVGAYGMFLRTLDGGASWQDWAPNLDNPSGYHLNGIARITGDALVVVGEAGQIHSSVDGGETWELRDSPYTGSLFGVTGTGQVNEVLAFGLRGNVLRSTDIGRSWVTVANDNGATLNGSAVASDGRISLVGNGGVVLMSTDAGQTFSEHVRSDREGIMDAVPISGNRLLLLGEGGVKLTDARGRNPQ